MKYLLRFVAHLIFVCGMLAFYVLPRNKYEWMRDLDPSIPIESLEDSSSGSRAIFTFILLAFMILAQSVLVAKSQSKKEKAASVALIVAAVVVWIAKFSP